MSTELEVKPKLIIKESTHPSNPVAIFSNDHDELLYFRISDKCLKSDVYRMSPQGYVFSVRGAIWRRPEGAEQIANFITAEANAQVFTTRIFPKPD